MLGLDIAADTVVVADFEAGIGTLTRLGDTKVDAVVVVAEPTAKSLEVAARATALAGELTSGPVVVVANRIASDADADAVREALRGRTVLMVPDDPAIGAADRADRAPLDACPDAPAVHALVGVAELLAPSSEG